MLNYIENYLPEVKKLVTKKALGNEKALRFVRSHGYNALIPGAVKIFMKEETFINFCMEHKHSLFGESKALKKVAKRPAKKIKKKK